MVSEIIGEMLKLSIVVMLVSVLSISVYAYLPDERIPYAEIIVLEPEEGSVKLIHAGGDRLLSSEVSIIVVFNNTTNNLDPNYTLKEDWTFSKEAVTDRDLPNKDDVKEIMVVHRRAVIYKGEPGWQNA